MIKLQDFEFLFSFVKKPNALHASSITGIC